MNIERHMAFRPSSSRTTISAFTDTIVSKKGSGAQVIVGLVIIIIGIGAGQAIKTNQSYTYHQLIVFDNYKTV